jgi:DNA-binding transcriptional ArsR family regulator
MTIATEKIFKALAHEKRLKILEWLKNPTAHFPPQIYGDLIKDGACVLFIAQKLGVTQPTATQHLKVLSDADLVISTRIGQWTFIKRNEAVIKRLKSIVEKEI